jgi:hypothetical protein
MCLVYSPQFIRPRRGVERFKHEARLLKVTDLFSFLPFISFFLHKE